MKIYLAITVFACLLACCDTYAQDCVENINKLPMYGGVKKCKEQIAADNDFLALCDKSGKTRKESAQHMIDRGWEYLYAKKYDTSMMRFNQAWLLDSLNADEYWGFADLLGMQQKYKESIPFFERALKINPVNGRVWNDEAISYGNIFLGTKDMKYLNLSIHCLKKAVHLEPNNPRFYGQLTSAYNYYMQKDSARKYMKITEQLDPSVVDPEVKKMLGNK